jgi:hypothetical protein
MPPPDADTPDVIDSITPMPRKSCEDLEIHEQAQMNWRKQWLRRAFLRGGGYPMRQETDKKIELGI